MMYAAVLLAFVVVVTADVPKEDIAKMDDLDVLLNRLTARAQNLKDKIDGKLNNIAEADRKSKNMILRMDRMNVNDGSFKCPRGENGKQTMFKCGTGQQCIGNILVCDNVADCLDGSDEDPDYCKPPMKEGDIWVGPQIDWECTPYEKKEFTNLTYIVTTYKESEFSNSVNKLVTNVFWIDEISRLGINYERSQNAYGSYNYADRKAYLKFDLDGKHVLMTYTFNDDNTRFYARSYLIPMMTLCQKAILYKTNEDYKGLFAAGYKGY